MLTHKDPELDRICNSRDFVRGLNTLDYLLKLSALKVSDEYDRGKASLPGAESELWKNPYLVLDDSSSNPPRSYANWRLLGVIWRSHYTRLLCFVWTCYIVLRNVFVGLFHFKHDMLLKQMKSSYRTIEVCGTQNCTCHWESQKLTTNKILSSKIDYYYRWLEFVGDPYVSISGLPMTMYFFGAVCPLLLYATYIGKINCKLQVAHLGFLLNPGKERARFRLRLEAMIDGLIKETPYASRSIKPSDFSMTPKYYLGQSRFYSQVNEHSSVRMIHLFGLNNIFLQIKSGNSNAVTPANLNSEWLCHLSNINYNMLKLFKAALVFALNANFITLTIMELYERTKRKLSYIRCNRKETQLVTSSNQDEILPTLLLEAKLYLSGIRLLNFVEIVSFIVLCSNWAGLYLSFPSISAQHWLRWTNQIESQLDDCLKLFENYSSSLDLIVEHRTRLIVSSYINYSLYKNQYVKFRETMSFLMGLYFGVLGPYLIVLYFTAVQVDSMFKWQIINYLVAVAIMCNLYLVGCCYLLLKAENIMRKISRLLALGAAISDRRHKLSMLLWQRQLLDTSELKNHFAIRLYGFKIHNGLIITLNTYLFALIMLYK